MPLHQWFTFAAVSLAVSLAPGPAIITIVSAALRGGFAASLAANAGVLVADALFTAIAASGLGGLLLASHSVFLVVKWLGVAYLAYLGVRAIRDPAAITLGVARPAAHAFRTGLMTQLANPKIILFMGALLPQFVDPSRPVAMQFAILGLTFIVSDAIVFACYGAAAHRASAFLRSPKAARGASRLTGVAMLGIAARLAIQR
jgi:threonine/homoserine/homoserine lactone efflux protein